MITYFFISEKHNFLAIFCFCSEEISKEGIEEVDVFLCDKTGLGLSVRGICILKCWVNEWMQKRVLMDANIISLPRNSYWKIFLQNINHILSILILANSKRAQLRKRKGEKWYIHYWKNHTTPKICRHFHLKFTYYMLSSYSPYYGRTVAEQTH